MDETFAPYLFTIILILALAFMVHFRPLRLDQRDKDLWERTQGELKKLTEEDKNKDNIITQLGNDIQDLKYTMWSLYRGATRLVDQLKDNEVVPVWEPNGELDKFEDDGVYGRKKALALFEKHLTINDVRYISFQLKIDYENLPGESKRDKIISLLEYVKRHTRCKELFEITGEMYPRVKWSEIEF